MTFLPYPPNDICLLFLTYEYVDWTSVHRPVVANLVLQETAIRLLDVLWQVGVEHERRNLRVGQLCAVLDLDVLALD